jgi:hypothetical protein
MASRKGKESEKMRKIVKKEKRQEGNDKKD